MAQTPEKAFATHLEKMLAEGGWQPGTNTEGDKARARIEAKDSPQFRELIAHLRETGFNPASKQHVKAFNLRHPHAFQTLTPGELAP
jgi:hypothetical protein